MTAQTGPIMVGDFVVGTITFGLEDEVGDGPGSGLAYAAPGDFPAEGVGPHAFGVPSGGEHHGPTFRPGIHPHSSDGSRPPEKHGPTFRPGLTPRGSAPPAAPPKITLEDVNNAVKGTPPPHFSVSDVQDAVKGGKGGIDRSTFDPEVKAKQEELIKRAAAMVIGEVGANAPDKAKIVQLETAFNRAQYRGTSLEQALWDTQHHGESGYYPEQTYERGYRYLEQHPEFLKNFERTTWDKVVGGSNESDVGYGPMTGNASAEVAQHQFERGTPGYHLPGGDTYFREGPFTNELPRKAGGDIGAESLAGKNPIGVTRLGAGEESLAQGVRRGSANLFSSGRAAGMGIEGGVGQNLTSITTESGRTIKVNKEAAPYFKSFLDDLESRGYKINDLEGYAKRNKRGGGGWSEHAFGNAIDINPDQNPWRTSQTNLPPDISEIAAKHGLTWGGDWSSGQRDPMHFEWTGVRSKPSTSTAKQ